MTLPTVVQEATQAAAQTPTPAETMPIEGFITGDVIFIIAGGLVLVWLTLLTVFLFHMIRKYTLGDWDEDNRNPYEGETMSMPRGVFRGILTISLLVIVLILEVVSLKTPFVEFNGELISLENKLEQLMVAFQMMLAFYFGSKVLHHITSADAKKTKHLVGAAAQPTVSNAPTGEYDESGTVG